MHVSKFKLIPRTMCSDEQLDKIKAVIEKSYYAKVATSGGIIVSSSDGSDFNLQDMQEITKLAEKTSGYICFFKPLNPQQ